jgi:hypothetical protein
MTETKEYGQILDNQEISWIVQAFLRAPDRLEKGATEEDIIKVIKWAEDMKLELVLKFGIMHEIYRGALVLGLRDNDVVMSLASDIPTDSIRKEDAKLILITSILRLM